MKLSQWLSNNNNQTDSWFSVRQLEGWAVDFLRVPLSDVNGTWAAKSDSASLSSNWW